MDQVQVQLSMPPGDVLRAMMHPSDIPRVGQSVSAHPNFCSPKHALIERSSVPGLVGSLHGHESVDVRHVGLDPCPAIEQQIVSPYNTEHQFHCQRFLVSHTFSLPILYQILCLAGSRTDTSTLTALATQWHQESVLKMLLIMATVRCFGQGIWTGC